MSDSRKRMKRKRSSANALGCFVILLFIIGVLFGANFIVTKYMARVLGPINGDLSAIDKVSLPIKLFLARDEIVQPMSNDSSQILFTVEAGESPYSIAERMSSQGLIHSADVMLDYLIYTGKDTTIQQGEFRLDPSNNLISIVDSLMDPLPTKGRLVILPGWRIEEIAMALPTSGLEVDPAAFLDVAQNTWIIEQFQPQTIGVEGFIFPSDNQFDRNISVNELVNVLVSASVAEITPEMITAFNANGLSVYQAVVLASIIEKETVMEEEMPLIASVFYNRIDVGMLLQTDPTIQYALGQQADGNWWKSPLSVEDLEVLSPYNTYQVYGLPPAPISSPSSSALQAVAFPDISPYFYFQSECDNSGRHTFSETYAEHLDKLCP